MNKITILGILAVCTLSMITSAEAKSMDMSDIYGDVYLYSGESLTLNNNMAESHSITNINGLFDSGLIAPHTSYTLEFEKRGTFSFFDSGNTAKSGTVHVIIPEITTNSETVKAGDLFALQGIDFNPAQTTILILKPDGTKYQELTITPAGNGAVHLPIQTSKYDENGEYKVIVLGYDSAKAEFTIEGAVTQDNPLEESPVINGTQINNTVNIPAHSITDKTVNGTPIIPKSFDKDYLIQYAKDQIKFWTQMLAFLEGN